MNRLVQAESLYLRKHCDNPISWWPWCDGALAMAERENRPIFLSIGYSSCHWCTVMEGEAFSDPDIAAYLNANFLAIKVDREERPDLDSFYMQALQLITGSRGWPLNLFLTPVDRLPFYGGTYFPVEPKLGKPGFLDVLHQIHQAYATDTAKVTAIQTQIRSRLEQTLTTTAGELSAEELHKGLAQQVDVLISTGSGPSFPMIPYANAALRQARLEPPRKAYGAAGVCQQRGLDLALGGIFDHVGGGFHRYTVDPTWTVPHFEKMLYDNGQIVEYLADLWSTGFQEPAIERAISHTVGWLRREMTAPGGYFYSAQDADSFVTPDATKPQEGAFYTWQYNDLEKILTAAELQALAQQFTVSPAGNLVDPNHPQPLGVNVLQRLESAQLSASVEAALRKLFTARYGASPEDLETVVPACDRTAAQTRTWAGRIPPVTDTKLIVAWNSLMISGLAKAAIALGRAEYFELAATAARFILEHQWGPAASSPESPKRLYRINYGNSPSILAQSEDYALLIKALLDLDQAQLVFQSAAPDRWLSSAVALQTEFDRCLWSTDLGGYYNTDIQANLDLRERSVDDSSLPSANGVEIANLVRLFLLTEATDCLDRAERSLQAFSGVIAQTPQRCPTLLIGLDWFYHQTLVRTRPEMIQRLSGQYLPTVMLQLKADLGEGAVALVCQGLSCQLPATSEAALQAQLHQSLARAVV